MTWKIMSYYHNNAKVIITRFSDASGLRFLKSEKKEKI